MRNLHPDNPGRSRRSIWAASLRPEMQRHVIFDGCDGMARDHAMSYPLPLVYQERCSFSWLPASDLYRTENRTRLVIRSCDMSYTTGSTMGKDCQFGKQIIGLSNRCHSNRS